MCVCVCMGVYTHTYIHSCVSVIAKFHYKTIKQINDEQDVCIPTKSKAQIKHLPKQKELLIKILKV